MNNTDVSFCHKKDYIHDEFMGICIGCERRLNHKVNDRFRGEDRLSMTEFTPVKTKSHWHCDGFYLIPIKEQL